MSVWPKEFDDVLRAHCRFADPGEEIDPDASFVTLGVDSLSMLGLVVESAEVLGATLPPELLTAEALATPRSLWQVLSERRNGDAAG